MKQNEGIFFAKKFFNQYNALSYNNLVNITTFGQDYYWKKKISAKVTKKGLILDLACGTGILSFLLKQKSHDVFGIDLTYDYISQLKSKERSFFCINGVAEFLPFKNNYFDYVVSSYLPKYSNLRFLADECYRVLKKGGVVVLHDFIYPIRPVFQELWKFYFKILKLSGKILKNWSNVFDELDLLIMKSDWYVNLPKILIEKGFDQVISETLTFETSAIVCAKKNER